MLLCRVYAVYQYSCKRLHLSKQLRLARRGSLFLPDHCLDNTLATACQLYSVEAEKNKCQRTRYRQRQSVSLNPTDGPESCITGRWWLLLGGFCASPIHSHHTGIWKWWFCVGGREEKKGDTLAED